MSITRRALLGFFGGAGGAAGAERLGGHAPDDVEVDSHKISPGDLVVLRFPEQLALNEYEEIAANLRANFPEFRFLFLDGGASAEVFRIEPTVKIRALDAGERIGKFEETIRYLP